MRAVLLEGLFMSNKVRFAMFGLLIAAGMALAPSAFARGHVNLGINIGLPGIGIGFSDCRHCGGGYYGGGYYSGYVAPAYYAPAYYGPSYYGASYGPGYYESSYYGYPSYGSVYYSSGSGHRGYYSDRHHDRGGRHYNGDYGHRASYYDRSGYHH
jgi:hypothetical protein